MRWVLKVNAKVNNKIEKQSRKIYYSHITISYQSTCFFFIQISCIKRFIILTILLYHALRPEPTEWFVH